MRVLALLALAATPPALARQPEPKPKPDLELIQGVWTIVGLEADGKPEPEKNYKGNTFTFEKDRAVLKEGGHPPVEFSLALDPAKTPRTIDLAAKGGTIRGIYKLNGDDLVLCLSIGGARPTEFATKAGSNTEVFTLRRGRPEGRWERHADKALGFSVEMPGKPEERVRKADTPNGPVTTTLFVCRSDAERVSYMVAVTPLPGRVAGKAAEAALDAGKKAVVAEMAGTGKAAVDADREFKANGQVGRELAIGLEFPGAKDKVAARVRLFIAGDRLYALMVVGVEEGTKSKNVDRFWGSFRLPADKK